MYAVANESRITGNILETDSTMNRMRKNVAANTANTNNQERIRESVYEKGVFLFFIKKLLFRNVPHPYAAFDHNRADDAFSEIRQMRDEEERENGNTEMG